MMTTETILEVLRQHPFAEELQSAHIDMLTGLAREVKFERDAIIFREGDECSKFYLIVHGQVALEIYTPGRVLRIQTLGEGDELGWSSMLMRNSKHFLARALRTVHALEFDGAELLKACHENPSFGFAFMYRLLGVVSQRLQGTRVQLLDMYSPNARAAGSD
jgi:CRP/FNR family transcriptional regulator, cyclic AMP receptor protein